MNKTTVYGLSLAPHLSACRQPVGRGLEDVPAMLRASNKLFISIKIKRLLAASLGGLFGVEFAKLIGEKMRPVISSPTRLYCIDHWSCRFVLGASMKKIRAANNIAMGIILAMRRCASSRNTYEIRLSCHCFCCCFVTQRKKFVLANGAKFKLFYDRPFFSFGLSLTSPKPHYVFVFINHPGCLSCRLAQYGRYIVKPTC